MAECLPSRHKALGLIRNTAANRHGGHISTILALEGWREKNHMFKTIPGCTVSLNPAWAT